MPRVGARGYLLGDKMIKIEIYTSNSCPYCHRAKDLLESKGVAYKELNINDDASLIDEAIIRSGGRRTVPQIFIENHHVGGYDDLNMLEQEGKLEEMLGILK